MVRAAFLTLLLAAALAGGCAQLPAVPEPASAEPTQADTIAELEKVFWHCDYVATKRGVLATPMAACKYAMDELKRLKFNGRFNALVEWWRENKVTEHRKVEQADRANKV